MTIAFSCKNLSKPTYRIRTQWNCSDAAAGKLIDRVMLLTLKYLALTSNDVFTEKDASSNRDDKESIGASLDTIHRQNHTSRQSSNVQLCDT